MLAFRGLLKREHTDMVTAIATPIDKTDMFVSSSRDKSIIVWKITKDDENFAVPQLRLTGHEGYVQDIALSSDNQFLISASLDGDLRRWDLNTGVTTQRFQGTIAGVSSVALSFDDRQIVSASRDGVIKLWNTKGECEFATGKTDGAVSCVTIGPSSWKKKNPQSCLSFGSIGSDKTVKVVSNPVSCVRFCQSRYTDEPTIVSTSWEDKNVKVWNFNECAAKLDLKSILVGSTKKLYTVAMEPEYQLCASGGEDGVVRVWNLDKEEMFRSFHVGTPIQSLCFAPDIYEGSDSERLLEVILCIATTNEKIFICKVDPDYDYLIQELVTNDHTIGLPPLALEGFLIPLYCTSMSWTSRGDAIICGYNDGTIRVWGYND